VTKASPLSCANAIRHWKGAGARRGDDPHAARNEPVASEVLVVTIPAVDQQVGEGGDRHDEPHARANNELPTRPAGRPAVISLAVLGQGGAAAAYYLRRQAGCAADYYLGQGEQRGRWIGPGADALGLTGGFDAEREETFRRLLDGRGPDGDRLVDPVLRYDPRSQLHAGPLLTALEGEAQTRGVNVTELLDDPELVEACGRLARTQQERQQQRRRATADVRLAGRLAAAAGLDPRAVFRSGDGTDRYTAALAHAGERVDIRRAGYDVVVSTPKSVSVLYALGAPAVAERVRAAHETAVEQAQDYLQRHAAHALRGHQGDGARAGRVATDGLLVAAFPHRTSRADDPQLHTHLVIPNVLGGADGRWSAVDSRALHRHALTAGYLYQAVLLGELTCNLGVGWTEVTKGVAEVVGVPKVLLATFSTRRGQIDAELARTGGAGRAAPGGRRHNAPATPPGRRRAPLPRRHCASGGRRGPERPAPTGASWPSGSAHGRRPRAGPAGTRSPRCCSARPA
jgi:conjugative relaxase-like TrwC/TraI family protein